MADGTLKVGTITTSSGSGTITLGQSGETVTIPSGVTMTGMGKVLQVVSATDSTARSTTSTSFVTASSSATINITPSSTSSKIYVVCSGNFSCNDGNDGWFATIYRGATNLGNATSGLANGNSVPGITGNNFPTTMTILDSPNTISSVTYQLYVKVIDIDSDGGFVQIGHTISGSGNPIPTHITAFEIAG